MGLEFQPYTDLHRQEGRVWVSVEIGGDYGRVKV